MNRREGSDLFAVDAAYESIPSIGEVPETREEKRRRWMIRLIVLAVVLLLLAAAAAVTLFLLHLAQIDSAVEQAESDGRPASVQAALDLVSGSDVESKALRARLMAISVLEGSEPPDAALALVTEDLEEESGAGDRLIAATYLSLARRDEATAAQNASRLAPTGSLVAEAAMARALAAAGVANLEQGIGQARIAVEARPDSPRYKTLLGNLLVTSGAAEDALQTVQSAAEGGHPGARIVRARARLELLHELDQALADATAVVEAADATPREKAWASVLRGRIHSIRGERSQATAALTQATEQAPSWDELFHLELAEAWLRVENAERAEAALAAVAPIDSDPARASVLQAAALVVKGDRQGAARALGTLPDTPRSAYLRGVLAHAQGQLDEARSLFERAAADRKLELEARVAHARLEVGANQGARAAEIVAPLLTSSPEHPEVAAAAADAERVRNALDRGLEIVTRALGAHQNNALLLTARARLELAREDFAAAYASFEQAVTDDPRDADRQADFGIAARRTDHDDVARRAFDAALELSPQHRRALLGLLELDIDEKKPAEATAVLERVEQADLEGADVERLRARTMILTERGLSGIRTVRQGLVREGQDPELFAAMGRLYLQAEQYDAAAGAFARASELLGERIEPEYKVLEAYAYVRSRRGPPAIKALEDIPSELPPRVLALRRVVQGWIAFGSGARTRARELAEEAMRHDPDSAEARVLLGHVTERLEHFQSVLELEPALPEAMARVALSGTLTDEQACELVPRYLRAAPMGEYAEDIRQAYRCR
jgi:tetratricopeptide (TPR) repeat protein